MKSSRGLSFHGLSAAEFVHDFRQHFITHGGHGVIGDHLLLRERISQSSPVLVVAQCRRHIPVELMDDSALGIR